MNLVDIANALVGSALVTIGAFLGYRWGHEIGVLRGRIQLGDELEAEYQARHGDETALIVGDPLDRRVN